MRLPGNNTYTGQTILESGRLSVASLNSFSPANRKPGSSLGAPMDIESGEIVIGEEGKDGDCALIYTGTGESTDRVINLAGRNDTVTFDQSGTGPLKFTSPILISGYGADKTIALKGDTAGNGELAGNLTDPHDRTGKARTSLTKSGNGTWILSGANTFTGPTKLTQGTLAITNAQGLNAETEVDITEGATLQLDFKGEMRIGKLSIGGKPQPPGTYDAKSAPQFIKGSGVLKF
jgi:autotransporter-associated beta strand protein